MTAASPSPSSSPFHTRAATAAIAAITVSGAAAAVTIVATAAALHAVPRYAAPARQSVVEPAPRGGRIEGTVVISRQLTVRRPQFRPYAEPGTGSLPPASPPRDSAAAELKNVVVYLEGDSTRLPPPEALAGIARRGKMAQRGERFVPHVLPVLAGTTVDFPNDDDVYHNVFSLSATVGQGLDLGRYPKGQSRSFTFSRPGTVQLFCHIHSDMSGIVLVLANAYFAQPADDHRYIIDDVPEGDYTLVGWHERVKPITRRIHVASGQTTTADFDIPLPREGGGAAK